MKNEPQHMLNHMLNFWGKSEPHMLIDFMLIKKKHVLGISRSKQLKLKKTSVTYLENLVAS